MMNITHNVRLDLDKRMEKPVIPLMQADAGSRFLALSLFCGNSPWLLPPVDAALVHYRKADGTGGCYDTLPDGQKAWSVAGHVLTVALAPQVSSAPGPVQLAVTLVQEEKVLSTFALTLSVQGLPSGEAESEDYQFVSGFLPQPEAAQPGQLLAVQSVSADGKILALHTVLPDGARPEARGYSAYEVALLNGFSGTQEQWLASLQGTDGADGYSPIKGVDYWTDEDRQGLEGKSAYQSYVDAGGSLTEAQWVASFAQPKTPAFVDTLEEMTDPDQVYVLKETGILHAYGQRTEAGEAYLNLFKESQATWNVRLNSSGGTSSQSGAVTTGHISCTETSVLRVKGLGLTNSASAKLSFFDAGGSFLNNLSIVGNANITLTEAEGVLTLELLRIPEYYAALANGWSSIRLSGDAAQGDTIIITVDQEIREDTGSTVVSGWFATGLTYCPADYEYRIVDLENLGQHQSDLLSELIRTDQEHGSRLQDLEQVMPGAVPDYWQTAMDELKPKMEICQAGGLDCFQFVWFSDIHGIGGYVNTNGQGTSSTAHLGVVAQALCRQYDIPLVAVSGDLMSQSSHRDVAAVYGEYQNLGRMLSAIDTSRLAVTIGNHDGAWGAAVDGVSYLKYIGNRILFNKVFRRQTTDLQRVFGPEGTCFYVDSHPQKLRFVMLNFHTDGDGSNDSYGFAVYNSMKHFVLGSKQLQWLQQEALAVEEGWQIVLMGHPSLLDEDAKDASSLINMIRAYNHRSPYTAETVALEDTYWGSSRTGEYNVSETCSQDFSQAKGEIIAYFHGHNHKDTIRTEELPCPMIGITTAGGDVRDTDYTAERVPGTATETAMDIVTIDRVSRTISMTRLGAGNDRQVIY